MARDPDSNSHNSGENKLSATCQTPGDGNDHKSIYCEVEDGSTLQVFELLGIGIIQGNTGKQYMRFRIDTKRPTHPSSVGKGVYSCFFPTQQPHATTGFWSVIDYISKKLLPTRFSQAEPASPTGGNSCGQLQQAVNVGTGAALLSSVLNETENV